MASSYLRGIEWVFSYYTRGQDSVTWLWFYPYDRAPLFSDVNAALEHTTSKSRERLFDVSPVDKEIRHTALHQLLMVMPQKSVRYVPEILHNYYVDETPIRWMMPISGVRVNTDFCEKEYQGNAIVTDSQYYVVCKELEEKIFAEDEISIYQNQKVKRDDKPVSKPVERKEYEAKPKQTNSNYKGGNKPYNSNYKGKNPRR